MKRKPTAWSDFDREMRPVVEQNGYEGKQSVIVSSWEEACQIARDLTAGRKTFKEVFGKKDQEREK